MNIPKLLLYTLPLFMLASCAAQFPLIASAMESEATSLKSLCEQRQISTAEKLYADSVLTEGLVLLKKNKKEAAYALFNRAGTCYHIALATTTILLKEQKIEKEEKELNKNREEVTAYKQVLKELKTMELQ